MPLDIGFIFKGFMGIIIITIAILALLVFLFRKKIPEKVFRGLLGLGAIIFIAGFAYFMIFNQSGITDFKGDDLVIGDNSLKETVEKSLINQGFDLDGLKEQYGYEECVVVDFDDKDIRLYCFDDISKEEFGSMVQTLSDDVYSSFSEELKEDYISFQICCALGGSKRLLWAQYNDGELLSPIKEKKSCSFWNSYDC